MFLNRILICWLATLFLLNAKTKAELTPPYFNLAEGRKIQATATCGVDYDGPELYCKLVGANTENDPQFYSLIQGQVCDYCDPTRPDKSHPPVYAIDGTENWWQSPPLSRGMKYNEVNLTIDFGQEFHVAYLFIRMGNSPRPGLWTLEKSNDYGKTWTPWQHFSDTPADCETYFGKDSLRPITRDDDVICTTEYSKIVPLENGEIPVMLLNNRPSANNYFNSTTLQEWTRATNVRIRLLRTKNLLGHLMSVARQDPTVTRRYFYSIKDISIGGRCMCNGHADTCHILDASSPNRVLACQCRHNTCGIQCADCCPGFEQKKWRQNTNAWPFQCEPCNCFGHSNTCVYDEDVDDQQLSLDIHGKYEGGGVCQNCQHNTEGINCNKCKPTFYRPYGKFWNETDVCKPCNCNYFYSTGNCAEETGHCECRKEFQPPNCDSCSYGHFGYPDCKPCECNLNGTDGYYCEATHGRCPCKNNFAGDFCEKCADGYYNFPECIPCECNFLGSVSGVCNETSGQCQCKSNFAGKHCDTCKDGYYDYPACSYCNCDIRGTVDEVCDKKTSKCICREGYGGSRCDQCLAGFYNYPDCIPCNCSINGSTSTSCDVNGKCRCLGNFAGKQCTMCSAGYYQYPECLPCNCDPHGSNGISCNAEGQCLCEHNFDGKLCNQCKEGFYNFPACEECNCDPAGVIAKFAGCGSVPAGELCQCKHRVAGRICDQCKPLYWNLNISNPEACEECDCFVDGTVGALDTCDTKTGQCACKPAVGGRTCDQCKDGTFDLYGGSLFGCKDCGCDIGGAINSVCDKISGQCKCHPRISGRTCTYPLTTHYYPTLYQYQYEYEDGHTPFDTLVRYQFNEIVFPEFSKKGYAVFSYLQNEVINEVYIFKSSVYRVVIRYVNPSEDNIIGQILIQSDNPNEADQTAKVLFKPTDSPQFVTVSGSKGEIPSPVVLDPGRYTIKIKIDKTIFLDYFVLLPAAYYEASVLTRKIENPCEIGHLGLCRHYTYPSIIEFAPSYGPYVTENGKIKKPFEFYDDNEHLFILNEDDVPLITSTQPKLHYNLTIPRSGKYIVVVDYITDRNYPETELIHVYQSEHENRDNVATLYPCAFTTVCRQPVIDSESREKIFWFAEKEKSIVLDGGNEGRVAIKSVTAIPVEHWSLDYINPSPVCVTQDGKCVKGTFRAAPDSKKIEFEMDQEVRISQEYPPLIFDNATKLIYLNKDESTIIIRSKTPSPGRYVIMVKFYQPYHPKFNVDYKIETDRQNYDGKFAVRHCPSNSGCRELIKQDSGYMWFDIDENFILTLTNNQPHGVWLDYILLVPADQFNENLLQQETFDQTQEFIKKCGHDHYHIKLNATDFCKQSVFSLTADYNNGALLCSCDPDGSTSYECDPFGGQCQCKPNIIGRQCEACKTGFYGFPDCQPCDCPSTAQCEKTTGECICPPRVTGEKCDQCAPRTFGFDQVIGCEECNCSPLGVEHRNLQCDLNNGSCSCRMNIVGRTCDKCQNGYFNFPYCEPCSCDTRGTTFDICDQTDETCFCKKNVQGINCRDCADGTYNLQASNPEGCTKCFCFGKTTRCESAFLRAFNVSMLKEVSINTINVTSLAAQISKWPEEPKDIFINETMLEADLSVPNADNGLVYFGVLDFLLDQNNHLTAYGGFLTYTLYYTTGPFGNPIIGPDVILEGKNIVIIHQNYQQPANAHVFHGTVKMVESNFETISGAPVSREQFMQLLRDLNGIYIRAIYWEQSIISRLSDVYLTMADEDTEHYDLYEELAVERCQCPAGYMGLSCEDCAPGYYRDPNGPYGGYCVPCQCNGHARTCDCNTGVCDKCQHYTTGDHCDECIEGYYGNATHGTPHDCMICACPMPIESNNFATSCEVSDGGYIIHCECRKGYVGPRCESCAAGYYGQPEVEGEICKPCDCSGNINIDETGACDSVTGECIMCLNNTFGRACNICAPGFYGDAIKLKDCQSCICDQLGTEHCDSHIGTCHCHLNVIGDKCDRCEEDHYGFDSGLGCKACDCGVASNSTQCDEHTGECRCKPGVTGRQCDRCLPGYWNYTTHGCVPCSCNTDYSRGLGCNAQTGQCECLPGVVGEKCDACPYRWVLIQDSGCQECDICHHALLDVTDSLKAELDPVILDFETVASGYFTAQKLNYFNEIADKIEPEVKALDPKGVNLNPTKNEVETLEMDVKSLERRTSYADQNANDLNVKGDKLQLEADEVLDGSRLVNNNVRNTIRDVKKLADSLDSSESTKIDSAKQEAESILEKIKEYKIDFEPAEIQLEQSSTILTHVLLQSEPVVTLNTNLKSLQNNTKEFLDKLEDIFKHGKDSLEKSKQAKALNTKNKDVTINSKFDTVNDQIKEAQKHLEDGRDLLKNTSDILKGIKEDVNEIDRSNYNLKVNNDNVDNILPEKETQYQTKEDVVISAGEHAQKLKDRAEDLTNQLSNITSNSETALKAATAYTNIVDSVNDAKKTVLVAKYAAGNATELSQGVEDRAGQSEQISSELLEDGRNALNSVQMELQPHLNQSTSAVNKIIQLNQHSDDQITAINMSLDQIVGEPLTNVWRTAKSKSETANQKAQDSLKILNPLVQELPNDLVRAKQLPKDVDKTKKDITQITNQVEQVKTFIPTIENFVQDLEKRHENVDLIARSVSDKIGEIRQQIEMARDVANSIKVGVNFHPNTTLELKTPPTLSHLATNSHISTYFKTEKPNGFLMYLGNEQPTEEKRPKHKDFMALEIENGYPVLTTDLGYGPERLINNKYVADGKWYEAIVDRTGNNIQLTIREELDDGTERLSTAKEVLPGPFSVFNVDEDSRLFVGGFPPDFNIQDGVKYSSFEGQIENLKVGHADVGLWNFVDGQDNTDGALERDRLITKDKPATGFRFNGNGYAILDAKPYSFKSRSSIQFKFKASRDTADGLLFYAGKHRHFISIEMKNGGILFQYKLGQHSVSIGNEVKFNDDKWHTVEAEREGRSGHLKVDGKLVYQQETPFGTEENLKISDTMYFGGHPGHLNHTEVTNKGFDGCIDDVFIAGTPVDLSRNLKVYGTQSGCPSKFASTLSYLPLQFGYLRSTNVSSNNQFQVTLKMRSKQEEGVIFYATNNDQSSTIGLVLHKGRLILTSNKESLKSEKYNDGEMHVVTVTHDSRSIRMDIDDSKHFSTNKPPTPLLISQGEIYFGGLPLGYRIAKNALKTTAYFAGCISDVTINGDIVNFASSTDWQNSILDDCQDNLFSYDPLTVPIFYPEDEVGPVLPPAKTIPPDDTLNVIHREDEKTEAPEITKPLTTEKPTSPTRIPTTLSPEQLIPKPVTTPATVPTIATTTIAPTTITTRKPTTKKPSKIQEPEPICQLPIIPAMDVDFDSGYRFGLGNNTRVEYSNIAAKPRKVYDISLEFKTDEYEADGILFYTHYPNPSVTDYISLSMQNGFIFYSFNCGQETGNLTSKNSYSTGEWHRVRFTRQNTKVKLIVDDIDETSGESICSSKALHVSPAFYIGGVPPKIREDAYLNIKLQNSSYFRGCIRNLKASDRIVNETLGISENVFPCSEQVERGAFFGGGYVKLREKFRVGTDMTISLDIKPRTRDGLLLSVHGRKAFLILQLVNGTISFVVDNGDGPFEAVFAPDASDNFCDGQWRTVTIIKSKFVITILVNQINSKPQIGPTKTAFADTSRSLFMGGHPHISRIRGLTSRQPYYGCIRNVKIRDQQEYITPSMTVGSVQTGVCPTI